jgi:hypothetical protein
VERLRALGPKLTALRNLYTRLYVIISQIPG